MASLLHHRHTLPELRSAVPGDEQVARLEDWLGFSIPEARFVRRPQASPGFASSLPDRMPSRFKDDKSSEMTPPKRSGELAAEDNPPGWESDSGDCGDGCDCDFPRAPAGQPFSTEVPPTKEALSTEQHGQDEAEEASVASEDEDEAGGFELRWLVPPDYSPFDDAFSAESDYQSEASFRCKTAAALEDAWDQVAAKKSSRGLPVRYWSY